MQHMLEHMLTVQAHEDGPVYFPAACILTLGASAVMHFTRKITDGMLFSLRLNIPLAQSIAPAPCSETILYQNSSACVTLTCYGSCQSHS